MRETTLDHTLIEALLEHWRPETHTFHMPFGEMTVTLEDVGCLWGLPIRGDPVIGKADGPWHSLVERSFGMQSVELGMKQMRKKKKGSDEVRISVSSYTISLKKLRQHFQVLANDATPEQVDRHTRAFIMDLFGSMIFADSSGDSVPAMYLQFFENLDQPKEYNWGAATLSFLYRQLCVGVERERKELAGPLVLLQYWCWERIPPGRSVIGVENSPEWGKPDQNSCPVVGKKWCGAKTFLIPHNAGIEYYRKLIDAVENKDVIWQPYREVLHLMPYRVVEDQCYWLLRLPLIHFWMVEYHYPERVMRQFGLKQTIPPREPRSADEFLTLHDYKHVGKPKDWNRVHEDHIENYRRPKLIDEEESFDQLPCQSISGGIRALGCIAFT